MHFLMQSRGTSLSPCSRGMEEPNFAPYTAPSTCRARVYRPAFSHS